MCSWHSYILDSPDCNLPIHTRNTTVRVHGMPWCAKIDYCTRTHTTRFGKPVGFPIPVPIPTSHTQHYCLHVAG
jgi:hypothetical protein